jgi:UDP-N-acetylmuramate dehydrogenase
MVREAMASTLDTLTTELPGLLTEAPLAPQCAYGVGGPAEYLFAARSSDELVRAAVLGRELDLRVTVLGRATNVLVADAGLRGLVVLARNDGQVLDGELITAGAGAVLPDMVTGLAERGLAGLEFAGNIPGSVGGAVVGNAGAYGSSVGDALVSAQLLIEGRVIACTPDQLDLGYRTSALKRGLQAVVVEATFALHGGERSALLDQIARDAERRRSAHPLEYASCGSFFKNPSSERPAAALIEQAGLKGLQVGRATVSRRHANFLVAEPGATAADLLALAAEVKRRVRDASGEQLAEEVVLLGFD